MKVLINVMMLWSVDAITVIFALTLLILAESLGSLLLLYVLGTSGRNNMHGRD